MTTEPDWCSPLARLVRELLHEHLRGDGHPLDRRLWLERVAEVKLLQLRSQLLRSFLLSVVTSTILNQESGFKVGTRVICFLGQRPRVPLLLLSPLFQ
jgi:hypothetical protein